jgi:molybdopterin-binding protein
MISGLGELARAAAIVPARLAPRCMPWYIPRPQRHSKHQGGSPMKISARNKLHGTIVDVTKGATTAHVRIDLGGGSVVTASITNEAVDELKLKKGEKAYAVIKATDVMVGLD